MTVRVYVPTTLSALARFTAEGGVGPSPVRAHAATEWLRTSWPEADEDELAYAALMAAADDSAVLLESALATDDGADEERPRRVVLVAEVEQVTEDRESTAVDVDTAISWRLLQAVHVDTHDVDPASDQDPGDLGWFGVQEIPDLLA
jgi:hypothetical protein